MHYLYQLYSGDQIINQVEDIPLVWLSLLGQFAVRFLRRSMTAHELQQIHRTVIDDG
jgi:hypothetical protein